MADPGVLEFGSRAGSYSALLLFGSIFAVLGFGVWREIRRRAPHRRRGAFVLGALLFAGPTTLVYVTSLNGFYQAEVRDGVLVLRHLHPITTEIPLAGIADVRALPAFRGRWRLSITDVRGIEYVSATWHRDAVQAGAARLRMLAGK